VTPRLSLLLTITLAASVPVVAQSAPTFDQLSASAQQAYQANKPEEAARLYTSALQLRPDWPEGWWALGMIEYERDQYPACRDDLRHMVELDKSAAPGFALLGLCEFQTSQYDDAVRHLKQAHMLVSARDAGGPLLDMANFHLAMLLTRQGAFELALQLYQEVALRVRDNPDMAFAAGLACLRMPILPADAPPDRKPAITMAGKAFWDLITQPPEQAESDFKALVAAYPSLPNVHYFYGTFLAARHPEQCTAQFEAELRISPDSVPARVQLALRALKEQKIDRAVTLAKEAVALSPESVGAQLALGEALTTQGKDEAALTAYQQAERLDPDSAVVRLYIMKAYRALGRAEDVRREQAEYQRLTAAQPNWP
jgi:tetratricopeptide (TPR) repeat protein